MRSKPSMMQVSRYLQFDDVYWGSLCNNHLKPEFEADKAQALENIQVVLAAKPADMVITTHVCRGNFRSTYLLTGAYDPIADALFGQPNTMATSWNMMMSVLVGLNH